MKKLKWIVLSLSVLLLVGGVGGGLALKSWLGTVLTRESLIRQLETQWNCRADVTSLTFSLWSSPARVEITNLNLAPRDAEADVETPVAARKPLTSALAGADHVVLEVDLADLVHRRLHVKRLTLTSVRARNEISEDGGNLLAKLFSKPLSLAPAPAASKVASVPASGESTSAAPAPAVPETAALPPSVDATPAPDPKEPVPKKHRPVFQASALGMGVVIDEARVEQGSYHENNRVAHSRTDVGDLNLTVSQVDVDPGDLEHHNQCKIDLAAHIQTSGRTRIGNDMQNVKTSDFTFETHSSIQPIDPSSGELAPSGTLDLLLKKGSSFGGFSTLGELAGNDKGLANAKKNFGIDISGVKAGGTLEEDMHTAVKINGQRVEFTKDARLLFPEYTGIVRSGSWLNGGEDLHEMQIQLLPSETLSKSMQDGVKGKLGDGGVKIALGIFNDGQGHLAFDLISSGHLSKPKVEMGGQAGALQNLFKGFLK